MGRDKALLVFDGETLVERALGKMGAVCASIAIAGGGEELQRFGTVVPDARPGCGPLGGIVAALAHSELEWNLFLPVDVPLLPVEFLRKLAERCLASAAVAVLPRVEGRVEPLCAAYSGRALREMKKCLDAGRFKVTDAMEAAGPVEFLEVEGDRLQFANVNTPKEFEEAERYMARLRH
jgi:molybdopterin-guanine dinucleotide biosynthesis protein A